MNYNFEIFSDEQRKVLKDIYIAEDHCVDALIQGSKPSKKQFRIINYDWNRIFMIDDFEESDGDYIFHVGRQVGIFSKNEIPEEVIKLLNSKQKNEIDKTQYGLSRKQQKAVQDVYVIIKNKMHSIVQGNKPIESTFKVIDVMLNIAYTVKDFSRMGDKFVYINWHNGEERTISKQNMPQEVVNLLEISVQ